MLLPLGLDIWGQIMKTLKNFILIYSLLVLQIGVTQGFPGSSGVPSGVPSGSGSGSGIPGGSGLPSGTGSGSIPPAIPGLGGTGSGTSGLGLPSTVPDVDLSSLDDFTSELGELRGALDDFSSQAETTIDEALNKAGRIADRSVKKLGEVFTPGNILMGAAATSIGLASGTVILNGIIGGTEAVIKKLMEDQKKINYEIFYDSLVKLDKYLSSLDELMPQIEKAKKLLATQKKLSPVLNSEVSDSDIESFVDKVTCHKDINDFDRSVMKGSLLDLIEKMRNPEALSRKLCLQLTKLDEIEAQIDSLGRILNIHFDDMVDHRRKKFKKELRRSARATHKRNKRDNVFIDKARSEALSCVDSKVARKGTVLENLNKDPRVLNHPAFKDNPKRLATIKDDFKFSEVWNLMFASYSTAGRNGFTPTMAQDEFNANIYGTFLRDNCFNEGFRECFPYSFRKRFPTDSTGNLLRSSKYKAAQYISNLLDLERGGSDLMRIEEKELESIKRNLRASTLKYLGSPYGNVIFTKGPTTTATSGLMQIKSDVGNLSCNQDFVSDKKLCQEMLSAFKKASQGESCKKYYEPQYVKEKGDELLRESNEIIKDDMIEKIAEEEAKLDRLRKTVEKISNPGSKRDLEDRLREIDEKHRAFLDNGMCMK